MSTAEAFASVIITMVVYAALLVGVGFAVKWMFF